MTQWLRRFKTGLTRVRPWAERVLNALDWADWKTWVWYALLGVEQLTTVVLVWAKRKTHCPAEVRLKHGRFYVVPKKG